METIPDNKSSVGFTEEMMVNKDGIISFLTLQKKKSLVLPKSIEYYLHCVFKISMV